MALRRVFFSCATVLVLGLLSLSFGACSNMDGSMPSGGAPTSKGSGSGGY